MANTGNCTRPAAHARPPRWRYWCLRPAGSLTVLPVKLQYARAPIGIITLKNRTLSPVAQLFIQTAREVAKPLAGG